MDPRLRNRGALKLGIGAIFFVGFMVVLALHRDTLTHRQFTENEKVIAILWYLVVAMIGIWGSIDLAKAKGHGSEIVAFILVTGFCLCPIFYLLMPFIILFALDDREPRHGRHRH